MPVAFSLLGLVNSDLHCGVRALSIRTACCGKRNATNALLMLAKATGQRRGRWSQLVLACVIVGLLGFGLASHSMTRHKVKKFCQTIEMHETDEQVILRSKQQGLGTHQFGRQTFLCPGSAATGSVLLRCACSKRARRIVEVL